LNNVATGDNEVKEDKKDNSDNQASVKNNQVSIKDMMQDL